MDTTRKVQTNYEVPKGKAFQAPMNQFSHANAFPPASFSSAVPGRDGRVAATVFAGKSLQPYCRESESTVRVVTESQDRTTRERSVFLSVLVPVGGSRP
jgi:hypothetical protein